MTTSSDFNPAVPLGGVYLPAKYEQMLYERYVQQSQETVSDRAEDRPQYYVEENADSDEAAIVIANGTFWSDRAPLDELKGMADEMKREWRTSEKHLSWGDRQKAIQQRWLDHLEAVMEANADMLATMDRGRTHRDKFFT